MYVFLEQHSLGKFKAKRMESQILPKDLNMKSRNQRKSPMIEVGKHSF